MIKLFKEDKYLFLLVSIYSSIFSLIIYLFSLIMSLNLKTFLFLGVLSFYIYLKFISALIEEKLIKKLCWFTIYFIIAPFLSFIVVTISFYINNIIVIKNDLSITGFYFISMLLPYFFIGTILVFEKYRLLIKKNLKIIKLSLSLTIALITSAFTFVPLLSIKEYTLSLYIIALIPFSLNMIMICIIEYFQIRKEIISDIA